MEWNAEPIRLLDGPAVEREKMEFRADIVSRLDLSAKPLGPRFRVDVGHQAPITAGAEQDVEECFPGAAKRLRDHRHLGIPLPDTSN